VRPLNHLQRSGDGLGVDERGAPFQKAGAVRTMLDWTTFYALAGRPDLVETSRRHLTVRKWLLGGAAVGMAGGGLLMVLGFSEMSAAHTQGVAGIDRMFQGGLVGDLGTVLAAAGIATGIAGLVISPDLGSRDENRRLAAEHNAQADASSAELGAEDADPTEPARQASAVRVAPVVTSQSKGVALSLAF